MCSRNAFPLVPVPLYRRTSLPRTRISWFNSIFYSLCRYSKLNLKPEILLKNITCTVLPRDEPSNINRITPFRSYKVIGSLVELKLCISQSLQNESRLQRRYVTQIATSLSLLSLREATPYLTKHLVSQNLIQILY